MGFLKRRCEDCGLAEDGREKSWSHSEYEREKREQERKWKEEGYHHKDEYDSQDTYLNGKRVDLSKGTQDSDIARRPIEFTDIVDTVKEDCKRNIYRKSNRSKVTIKMLIGFYLVLVITVLVGNIVSTVMKIATNINKESGYTATKTYEVKSYLDIDFNEWLSEKSFTVVPVKDIGRTSGLLGDSGIKNFLNEYMGQNIVFSGYIDGISQLEVYILTEISANDPQFTSTRFSDNGIKVINKNGTHKFIDYTGYTLAIFGRVTEEGIEIYRIDDLNRLDSNTKDSFFKSLKLAEQIENQGYYMEIPMDTYLEYGKSLLTKSQALDALIVSENTTLLNAGYTEKEIAEMLK